MFAYLSHLLKFVILLALTGCSQFNILDALVPTAGYRRTANLAYGHDPRQKLDVYQPKDALPNAGIVVFFYGGYWSYGSKDQYRFVAQALTSKGYIVVLPDYRLHPQVTFPAFVEDGALAIRWAHDNAERMGGDPSHIYLMGHSAGAHIAALLTLDGSYLRAVGLDRSSIRATAGLAGPYDFVVDKQLRPIFYKSPSTNEVNPAIEPIHFVDGHEPPMLLIHGCCDTVVEPGNSKRLAQAIAEKGGIAKLILYPAASHSGVMLAFAYPFHWLAPVLDDATDFFKNH